MNEWIRKLKSRARRDVAVLYLAARDPRVPLAAKLLTAGAVAYALSPIDLIPDFIPVLGLLDDAVLIPAALALAVWLIPDDVLADLRSKAQAGDDLPRSRTAALVIIAIWIAFAVMLAAFAAG